MSAENSHSVESDSQGPLDRLMYLDPRCEIDFDGEDKLAERLTVLGIPFGRTRYRCTICGHSLRLGNHDRCRAVTARPAAR